MSSIIQELYGKYSKATPQFTEVSEMTDPPCKSCMFWKPIAEFSPMGEFHGLRFCHADDMHFDFSCFRKRP